ncbi:MAG: nucleoside hydrolase [Bacteroidales bacterium]
MIKRIMGTILLAVICFGPLQAHSGKPKYHVVIDTDGALDDMRSISMLLSQNDIRVLALTCSQGTLLPDSVYVKVKSLLSAFHHEGIPVGIGEKSNLELPEWSAFAQNITWADAADNPQPDFSENATGLLDRTTENYPHPITLIALGSLKTYADWISANPDLSEKIERIIWYNHHDIAKGYNDSASRESYEYIRQTGIQLDVVSNDSDRLVVNEDYLAGIRGVKSVYARQIGMVHTQPGVEERITRNHLQLWDDLVPVYLTVPILFETETIEKINYVSINKSIPDTYVYEAISQLLESANVANNRVFVNFPVDPALYKPEYAKMITSTIENFGPIEWKAISMTNEIHGHTGIYSIIGAKMGIRAMEYFNVGVNNLVVITFAGSEPPLSCFNDGVQISSGATIGQGLITVSDSISPVPSALFEFNNQKVTISLNPEIARQMGDDIRYGIEEYGLLTDAYWLFIEKLAIEYWRDFDRHEIFTVKRL